MYLGRQRRRRAGLGNQQFDICDLYRGNPWGLEPLNTSCGSGGGAHSGGGGSFRAENQFPEGGFIGPSGAAAWGLAPGEPFITRHAGQSNIRVPLPDERVIDIPAIQVPVAIREPGWFGIPWWAWAAGGAVLMIGATR